jgi:predicted DNA-binding protein with PD1-like motif
MFFIKLEPNDDILEALTKAISDNSIQTGFFTMIGALKTANLGYYSLDQKNYKNLTMHEPVEIVSCSGNITLKDTVPMIHAHLVIADDKGHAFGGHLLPGNKISVTGEIFLVEAKTPLIRKLEDQFNLSLINLA